MFLNLIPDLSVLMTDGSGLTVAFAIGVAGYGWRGGISSKFSCIDNVINLILKNQPAWAIPPELLSDLVASYDSKEREMQLENERQRLEIKRLKAELNARNGQSL
jgi:hypothetical protein